MMGGLEPTIDALAHRAASAVKDAARSRVAHGPEPDELSAMLQRRRSRRRIATGVLAVAAVLAIVVVGRGLSAGVPGLTIEDVVGDPTREDVVDGQEPDVVGIWKGRRDDGCGRLAGLVLQLSPDGTFDTWSQGMGVSPLAAGTYEVDRSVLTFTNDRADVFLDALVPGDSWTWQVAVDTTTGELDVHVPQTHEIGHRTEHHGNDGPEPHEPVDAGTECSFIRVGSPTRLTETEAGWRLPSSPAELSGQWLLEDGPAGVVLDVGPGARYELRLDAWKFDLVDDVGTLQISEDGTLLLTSGGGNSCAAGDSWIWTNLRYTPGMPGPPDPERDALTGIPSGLTGTVSQDDCGRRLGPHLTWLRVFRR
jgi:hypothetical protein